MIPITPVPKPRMTQRDRWAKRPSVVRYYDYCDRLREAWGDKPVPAQLGMVLFMPMPNSWSGKKKAEMVGSPHQQRPDIDNLVKAFLDALCEDDSFVWRVDAQKIWATEPGIQAWDLTSES